MDTTTDAATEAWTFLLQRCERYAADTYLSARVRAEYAAQIPELREKVREAQMWAQAHRARWA